MNIHEYQASSLFEQSGIPVPEGQVVSCLEEAREYAQTIGFPLVLKAQVLTGGRGKTGGVKVVKAPEQLDAAFSSIKGLIIKDFPVDKIYMVRAIDIHEEFYAAVTVDPPKGRAVLMISTAGGVDIEETARTNSKAIHRFYLHRPGEGPVDGLEAFLQAVFPQPARATAAGEICDKLIRLFFRYDCTLCEINPLVIDGQGSWIAADAKMNFDDNALFRQPDVEALRDRDSEDPDEIDASRRNLSFVKMDGRVGCIVNGAGLAMATMDVINLLGGRPANFLDVGGSSNPQKVLDALKIILRNPKVTSILINIFGGITRCDDVAQGIIAARRELEIPVPMVVRLTGTNEDEAKALLSAEGIETYSSMRDAVETAVKLAEA